MARKTAWFWVCTLIWVYFIAGAATLVIVATGGIR
jgi:hypothetical protein